MTPTQIFLTLLVAMLGTVLTRFFSFLVFPAGKETPAFIRYLGMVLPASALGMLVVYCYKNIDLTSGTHGLPELLAGTLIIVLQKWKKNMFLSILLGTAFYFFLIRIVF